MKIKNKLVALLISIPALAKAYVVYIVGISILIVGGIMLYKLFTLTKQVFADPPPGQPKPTNTVDTASYYRIREYWGDGTNGYGTWKRDTFGALNTFTDETRSNQYALNDPRTVNSSIQAGGGFILQYGVNHPNLPWIDRADAPVSPNIDNIQTLPDGTITLSMLGSTLTVATGNPTAGDGSTTTFTNYGQSTTTVTNASGDTFTASTDPSVSVVIERTSDLRAWVPIFTNSVPVGGIQTYTDYTPLPDPITFTNSGSGTSGGPFPGSPGGTVGGTSVSTSYPGWYYRLKLMNTP